MGYEYMKGLIRKYASLELDANAGTFSAAASTPEIDSDKECLTHACLAKLSQTELPPLPMLDEHDPNNIVGTTTAFNLEELDGNDTLIARGRIFNERARRKAKKGAKLSLGFVPIAEHTKGGVRYFDEVEIREISIVRRPANPSTKFITVKSAKGDNSVKNGTQKDKNKAEPNGKAQNGDEHAIAELAKDVKSLKRKAQKFGVRLEDVEGTLDSQNAKPNEDVPEWKQTGNGEHEIVLPKVPLIRKAYGSQESVAGAPTDSAPPWYDAYEADPFMGIMPVEVSGDSWNITEVSGIELTREQALPANPNYGGDLDEAATPIELWSDRVRFSDASAEDVPMLREKVINAFRDAAMETKAQRIFDVLKASITSADAGSVPQLKTGVANGLPAADAFLAKILSVIAGIATKYKFSPTYGKAAFIVSSALFARLCEVETDGSWAVRPTSDGGLTLYQFPVRQSDILDSGAAAGDVSLIFGNLPMLIECGLRRALTISESTATVQGALSFYGSTRFGQGVKDARAGVGLITKA